MTTHGIHHITAIASKPQACYDFYAKVLGLRLVKKSVNQDQTEAYHLFFGDKTGEPGMDLTFFTFEPVMQGVHGTGQVTTISLAVPDMSIDFWQDRFKQLNINHSPVTKRFNLSRLAFTDHDGQQFELVGISDQAIANIEAEVWTTKDINHSQAIHAFHAARLMVASHDLIEPILTTVLGYTFKAAHEHIRLFSHPQATRASFIEVEESPLAKNGINAAGTVHHIAFRVDDEEELLAVRQEVLKIGLHPTEVIDRYYFKSVYFRTPAGILFELATAGPGFTVDEPEESLGEKLALPPFLEADREVIEARLTPIKVT